MNEAFEVLSDPVRRGRYASVLKGGGGTPEEAEKIQSIIDASTDFQRAEICWKKNDIANAERYITRAYKADPQSDYTALYVMIIAAKRPPDARVDDLIRLLDEAIDKNERCERAYFSRGNLKKRVDEIGKRHFRFSHRLQP